MGLESSPQQLTDPKAESPARLRRMQLDRFIPRRSAMNMDAARYLLNQDSSQEDVINNDKQRLRREVLRSLLEEVVFAEGLPTRVLLLGLSCRLPPAGRLDNWPARARCKPCISSPDAILDLPAFDPSIHLNILDWGSGGIMAAALRHSVFLCDLVASSTETLTSFSDGSSGTCVQWNTLGDKLAVANSLSKIQVWDTTDRKLLTETVCYCTMPASSTKCSIGALAWHPHGTYFASGCSWGTLIAFPFPGAQESCVVTRAHRGSITILRSSPDGRYVASSGTDGALRVWLWSDLTPHMEFTSRGSSIPVPAWHPWQSSYLAVGSHCLAVYNVNNASLLAKQDFHLHHVTVYCMTWSHLTGELVVSLWVHEDVYSETEEHAEVLVLATANKVVDKLDVHSNVGKVIYLMWSPDGRKIATAGSDETLQVWTFIKESSTVNKKRRQSEDFGYVIR